MDTMFLETLARTVTHALGFGIVESAALLAVVWLWIRMSDASATTRHALRWIALAASAILPLVSIASSLGRIERVTAPAPVRAASTYGDFAPLDRHRAVLVLRGLPDAAEPTPSHADAVAGAGAHAQTAQTATSTFPGDAARTAAAAIGRVAAVPHLYAALVALWLAVAAFGLVRLGRSLAALARIKACAIELDEAVVRRLRRWRHGARSGRAVTLCMSEDIDVPVAVGFRTPRILFPAAVIARAEIADLDQIAMHEFAHLERYDDWTNLAQCAIERVFWFNPFVALVGRQISLEREIACDDYVVAQTGRAHRYATCLWRLVESARLPASRIVAPGALLTSKQITVRIERLLDSRRNALPRLSPAGAIGIGALCIAVAIVQAVRAPVIALEVPAAGEAATAAAPVPAASPSPQSHARGRAETPATIVVRVDADATPQAVASAIAGAVSERERAVYKATVERSAIGAEVRAAIRRAHLDALAMRAQALSAALAERNAEMLDFANRSSRPKILDRASIARCIGCDLHGANLRGLDLHGLSLPGVNLRHADLRGANLAGTRFIGCDFHGAKLDDADLSDAEFSGSELDGASLARANLHGTRIVGTSIRGAVAAGTQLRTLVDGCFGCDLRGLDLRGQDLHGITLEGADMRDDDMRGANLHGARLRGVDLRNARVAGANLRDVSCEGCRLEGVALHGADVTGASFNATERGMLRESDRAAIDARVRAALAALRSIGDVSPPGVPHEPVLPNGPHAPPAPAPAPAPPKP